MRNSAKKVCKIARKMREKIALSKKLALDMDQYDIINMQLIIKLILLNGNYISKMSTFFALFLRICEWKP